MVNMSNDLADIESSSFKFDTQLDQNVLLV